MIPTPEALAKADAIIAYLHESSDDPDTDERRLIAEALTEQAREIERLTSNIANLARYGGPLAQMRVERDTIERATWEAAATLHRRYCERHGCTSLSRPGCSEYATLRARAAAQGGAS